MTTTIKIDKNIPVGPARTKHAEAHKAFERMEAGDSFALWARDAAEVRSARIMLATFSAYAKKQGWTVTSRTADGVLRIWRKA